jgi:hypothetical protein
LKELKIGYKKDLKSGIRIDGRRTNKEVIQEIDSTKIEITSDSIAY